MSALLVNRAFITAALGLTDKLEPQRSDSTPNGNKTKKYFAFIDLCNSCTGKIIRIITV